ncbi:Gfo/Idh/MocA family oxidoreductase [Thalassoroseus pseudoceratinae]|uniref:hypothetical protein n=1 Tax=Thalassoroseus pseudoceratinae TaxID=2713176 RepID=UPI00141F0FF5|nr:hypothetical protein [Thalassoroseus pseudoceratinae]
MVNLGIVGLGPAWETRYRPALRALRSRVRVCAVYDCVPSRAAAAAKSVDADVVGGIRAMMLRPDIRGILWLGTEWQGDAPLQFAIAARKPTMIAAPNAFPIDTLARLHLSGLSTGLTLMPEFLRRYLPATHRVQELLATRIGPARVIRATLQTTEVGLATSPELTALLDWCRHIARTPPATIQATQNGHGERLVVEFRQPRIASFKPRAEIHLQAGESSETPKLIIEGDQGRIAIEETHRIRWNCDNEETVEDLSNERPAAEVLIDHFCRRVVGGLIPVADLGDLCSHLQVLEEARRSLAQGRALRINPIDAV